LATNSSAVDEDAAGAGEEGGGGAGSAEAVATAGGEEKVAAGSGGSGGPSDGEKETEAAGAAAPTEVVQQKQQKQGRHGQGTGKRKQKAVVVETLRFGIVPAAGYWNYKPSSTLAAGHVAKACMKIHEALEVTGTKLDASSTAVDLGAAPGSWSQYLSPLVAKVYAVDPADIDEEVLALPNVEHIRKKAQDVVEAMTDTLDLIVCDMNIHPDQTTQICKDAIPMLKKGGTLLMTMKFNGTGRDKSVAMERYRIALGSTMTNIDCISLFANKSAERMLVAVKA